MKEAVSLFFQFFILGLTSFGGPAAHLGYFRTVFVEQKKWLTESEYSQLIALSQFLPGPGSSQVGFAIGLNRMGILGGMLAFLGFTLPSFLLMIALALGLNHIANNAYLDSFIHLFKLLAVVVVLDAVLTMGKSFCQRSSTQLIALGTCIAIWLIPMAQIQIMCLVFAGVVGYWRLGSSMSASQPINIGISLSSVTFLVIFVVCLLGVLPIPDLFSETFVAGSLVFGGGHVVLPLLQDFFGQTVGQESFITGYAAAQAVPGPMFTFATYLGALSHENAFLGASLATMGIFLPGFLLVLAFYKNWNNLAKHPKVSGVIAGINASVVGLLAATLYTPIFTSAVFNALDMAIVATGFVLLRWLKRPIIQIIALACLTALAKVWIGF